MTIEVDWIFIYKRWLDHGMHLCVLVINKTQGRQ
jgi:hypothetical protein